MNMQAKAGSDADPCGSNSSYICAGWYSAAGCNGIAFCDSAANAERECDTGNRAERDASDCTVRDSNTQSDAAVKKLNAISHSRGRLCRTSY